MKPIILLFVSICISMMLQAQVSKTVNATAGSLLSALTMTERNTVTNLTITGTIDARDFRTMRDYMPNLAEINLSGVTVSAYYGGDGTLQPSFDTYPANEVPLLAFFNPVTHQGKTSLSSIIFPSSFTSIREHAFNGCISLTSVTIPFSVTTIGANAFENCSGLMSVSISSSVESIGVGAFMNCTKLTSVSIPSSVTSIWNSCFANCSGLSSIYVNYIIPMDIFSSPNIFLNVNKTTCILFVPYGSSGLYAVANQWRDFKNIVEMPGLKLSSTTATVDAADGNTSSVGLTSNTEWSASSDQTWLKVRPTSGTGDHTLTFTAEENPLSSTRSAVATISAGGVESQSITITQDGGSKTTQLNYLNYRFSNPRIINGTGYDSFEFDVQVKANAAGTYLWSGLVDLSFNNATLSTNPSQWKVTKAAQFNANNSHGNPKYGIELTITGASPDKILNIGFSGDANALNDPPTSADFVEVTNSYQTLLTVSALITDENGVAGIDFIEANMNGEQFYKISESPWYTAYANPNIYDSADFMDTYVGRIFSNHSGWTQIRGVDYASAVNTSVWDGNVTGPTNQYFNATALRIHSPAILTISQHGQMTVTGDTEIKTINGLIIQSEDQYTGSFITGTASGAGSALTERYMKTDAWHIVSSPVAGQSISNFLTSNPNIATSEDNEVRGMMDYNPALNAWNDYFTDSKEGTLETGKGFCMRTNANSAVAFTGSLRTGPLSLTGLISEKWNCIGNPYTSAIGLNRGSQSTAKFLDENESRLDDSYGAIYVWLQPYSAFGPDGKYIAISNVYEEYDLVRVDISPGQGFLVKLKSGVTSINFNPEMQHHNTEPFFKSAKNSWPIIKLIASVNSQQSSTTIAFNQGMTKGLDKTYDAGLFKGGSDLVVYSRLMEDNGIPFAIQALPDNDFSSMIIPIGLDFNTGGDVVFTADLINLPSDCQVILEDKLSKTFTDLSYKDYTATIDANSSIADRFRLHTSYLTTKLSNGSLLDNLSAYAVRNVEIRVKGEVSKQAIATLYDLQGKAILVKTLEEGSLNIIQTPNIKTAVYMLSIQDNGKTVRFKIPVND